MPSVRAIASAVAGWSPVIITGVMPARQAFGNGGACLRARRIDEADEAEQVQVAVDILDRQVAVRAARREREHAQARGSHRFRALRAIARRRRPAHSGSTASGAPFTVTRTSSPRSCTVVIRLRSESNGSSAMRGSVSRSASTSTPPACA